MENELMTVKEVSRLLGKHEEVVRQMFRDGTIPAKKIGRAWYTWRSWLYQASNKENTNAQ